MQNNTYFNYFTVNNPINPELEISISLHPYKKCQLMTLAHVFNELSGEVFDLVEEYSQYFDLDYYREKERKNVLFNCYSEMLGTSDDSIYFRFDFDLEGKPQITAYSTKVYSDKTNVDEWVLSFGEKLYHYHNFLCAYVINNLIITCRYKFNHDEFDEIKSMIRPYLSSK